MNRISSNLFPDRIPEEHDTQHSDRGQALSSGTHEHYTHTQKQPSDVCINMLRTNSHQERLDPYHQTQQHPSMQNMQMLNSFDRLNSIDQLRRQEKLQDKLVGDLANELEHLQKEN